jgi:hypothetical protein
MVVVASMGPLADSPVPVAATMAADRAVRSEILVPEIAPT